jgi:hypothetical protein
MRRALEVSIDFPSHLALPAFRNTGQKTCASDTKAEAARAAKREYTLSRKEGQAIRQEFPGGE